VFFCPSRSRRDVGWKAAFLIIVIESRAYVAIRRNTLTRENNGRHRSILSASSVQHRSADTAQQRLSNRRFQSPSHIRYYRTGLPCLEKLQMRKGFGLIAASVLLFGSIAPVRAESPYAVYESTAAFDDVIQALTMAIQDKGMYINNVMHMDEMLERTGKDLGAEETIYLKAQSVEFCSAVLSRRMTSENPLRIVNCPFIVSVYVTPEQPDTTYVVHRKLLAGDDTPVMQEVAAMLESLGQAAAEGF